MTPDHQRDDERLSRLLLSWRVDRPDDPQLAHKVWQRIESGASRADEAGAAWWMRIGALLARPTFAAAAIVAFALLGGFAAQQQSSSRQEARLTELAAEYAYSIDPVLMTSGGHATAAH